MLKLDLFRVFINFFIFPHKIFFPTLIWGNLRNSITQTHKENFSSTFENNFYLD